MDDSRLKVSTTEDGSSTLTLDPAMPSDAGLYKGISNVPFNFCVTLFQCINNK